MMRLILMPPRSRDHAMNSLREYRQTALVPGRRCAQGSEDHAIALSCPDAGFRAGDRGVAFAKRRLNASDWITRL